MITRRFFLRSGTLALASFGLDPLFLDRAAYAFTPLRISSRGKTLVCLFQRGAVDGLNMVVPYGDRAYYRDRPRIALPRQRLVDLDGHFGLHPNVIEINVPSLRQRQQDIPLLTEHFLQKLAQPNNSAVAQLSPPAQAALQNYRFPGNVRELENTLERAYTLCENNVIDVADLQLRQIAGQFSDIAAENTHSGHTQTCSAQSNTTEHNPLLSTPSDSSLDSYLEEVEKQAILKALEETRWNRTAAAEKLGISFRQIRHRLKKFGIE